MVTRKRREMQLNVQGGNGQTVTVNRLELRNEIEDLVGNALLARQDFFKKLLDKRRDYDDECGYPKGSELTTTQYKLLYDREPIATRVVEVLPKECWGQQPDIYEVDDPGVETTFEKAWKDLGTNLRGGSYFDGNEGNPIWEHLFRADKLSGIGTFGVVLLGIDDGKPLSEPVEGFEEGIPQLQGGDTQRLTKGQPPQNKSPAYTWNSRDGKYVWQVTDNAITRSKRKPINPAPEEEGGKETVQKKQVKQPSQQFDSQGNMVEGGTDDRNPNEQQVYTKGQEVQEKIDAERANYGEGQPADEEDEGQIGAKGPQETDSDEEVDDQGNPIPEQPEVDEEGNPLPPESGMQGQGDMGGEVDEFGNPAEQQPDWVPVRNLLFIRVFDESLIQITRYESNMHSPRFGQPLEYSITMNDPTEKHSGVGLPLSTVKVHWSRVLHIADNLDSSEIFGVPRMRPVYNRILDLHKCYGGSAEGYWQNAFPLISLETHPQLGGDVKLNSSDVREQINNIIQHSQRWTAIAGTTLKTNPPTFVDPTNIINTHIQAICIKLGIPQRIFMGSERGELASSQDAGTWDARLEERQRNYVTPRIIIPFVDRLIQLQVLPEPEEGYKVTWPSLDVPTKMGQAQLAGAITMAISQYVSGGVDQLIEPLSWMTEVLGWDPDKAQAILEATMQHQQQMQEEQQMQQASAQGFQQDPETGEWVDQQGNPVPTDPTTGMPIPQEQAQEIDPETGQPVPQTDEEGNPITQPVAPEKGILPKGLPNDEEQVTEGEGPGAAEGEEGEGQAEGEVDEETGLAVDPETGYLVDEQSGFLIDKESGDVYDPKTGKVVGNLNEQEEEEE